MCHIALSPERLKATSYRSPRAVALELDADTTHSAASPPGRHESGPVAVLEAPPLILPELFRWWLPASIPAKFYLAGSAHGRRTVATVGFHHLVARALGRMEQVGWRVASL